MDQPVTAAADTLVGSLCREIWGLRSRAVQVQAALQRCQHPVLGQRLQHELQTLASRRAELQRLADRLLCCQDHRRERSLAVELLAELCRRPLVCA